MVTHDDTQFEVTQFTSYVNGNLVTHVYSYGKIVTHRRLFTHGYAVVYAWLRMVTRHV